MNIQNFKKLIFLLNEYSRYWKKWLFPLNECSGFNNQILDVFRCSQLFSDVFSWVVTFIVSLPVQCITTPCAHILWSVAGSGSFSWKSNWTKFDHVGNTGGYWETMSSSFSISFGSSKSVYAFYIVFSPWYKDTINCPEKATKKSH